MPVSNPADNEFLNRLKTLVEENISDEDFGVSELATAIGMSRSNLLRKINKLAGLSASQFIRRVRLEYAMELLIQGSFNVSEVSYKVGFSSTSYFIKCFREHYGYPPGEVGKRERNDSDGAESVKRPGSKRQKALTFGLPALIIMFLLIYLIFLSDIFNLNLSRSPGSDALLTKKSIAVLPFINDSDDSSNVYIINGLMESVLNNLQKIRELRVISRTSVEKYRNNPSTIPEIGRELNVHYIIEGSGQKVGDRIMLSIQLIEAPSDMHLWSEQYTSDTKDIFELQQEVAKKIAGEIKVFITPEEQARIEKVPTDDMLAYDHFLKGREMYHRGDFQQALTYYEKAIGEDSTFAQAYASAAISCFFIDFPKTKKQYSEKIDQYAEKALSYDPRSELSLIAKALYFYNTGEFEQAVPYLEKAREYNPNSALVNNTLADLYARFVPNTAKYIEYAIKGILIDIGSRDSVTASYTYLHLSNALIQSGFINEALFYIERSLEFDPDNIYSHYVRAYILYAKNRDLRELQALLINTLNMDTTRLDVLQEAGKSFYFSRKYEKAYHYYKRFTDITEKQQLDLFIYEYAKIGLVLDKMGRDEESKIYLNRFREFAEQDQSIYRHLHLASYYSYKDEKEKALEHLELFSREENFQYWFLVFEDVDPLYDNIREMKEYKDILHNIEKKFWEYHRSIRASLKEEGLLDEAYLP